MYLRSVCHSCARLSTAFAAVLAVVTISSLLSALPLQAASFPTERAIVRAQELQGFLANDGDMHYLGLEPTNGAKSIVITLAYRTPQGALLHDGVNFSVLVEEGLREYLSGVPLEEASSVTGTVLLANAQGTIVQATLQTEHAGGYTLIVKNSWQTPVRYVLTVHGGVLVDEGGQTLLSEPSPVEQVTPPELVESSSMLQVSEHETIAEAVDFAPKPIEDLYGSIHGIDTMRGSLQPLGDRNYFDLQPASVDGEISVRLSYYAEAANIEAGAINFWVLTQDGMRHVMRGALPMELNLATGTQAEDRLPAEMSAAVRLGGQDVYALIVFNESAVAVDYEIDVVGGTLALSGESDSLDKAAQLERETPAASGIETGLALFGSD